MKEDIIFKRNVTNVKKHCHLKNNVFLVYAPKNIKVGPMEYSKNDSGVVVFVPENSKCFLTSKFREDEINQIQCGEQRLWVGILNKSS